MKNGFTLMELVIVVALLSVIAAFAIPNFTLTMELNEERRAVQELQAVRAGLKIYVVRTGDHPTVALPDARTINQTLNISIIPGNLAISCADTVVDGYRCSATNPDGWTVHFHESARQPIHCGGGACPTCDANQCPSDLSG